MSGALARTARAYPALLRAGFVGMLAYRAEFLIWILTTNMPLVMLALWSAVVAEGPLGRLGPGEMNVYFIGILFVRVLTGSWMVWELTMDIRQGNLATRLLRPIHPLVTYSAGHIAAIPLRLLVVSPLFGLLIYLAGDKLALWDPPRFAIFVLSVVGAWLIFFLSQALIGTLALFIDSALSVFDLWFGVHTIMSGYLIPLELLPPWIAAAGRALPFRYMLAFPVETLVGLQSTEGALRDLGVQWIYVVVMFLLTVRLWRAGMKRFVAFGG